METKRLRCACAMLAFVFLVQYQGTIRDNTAVWDQACAGGKISSESMEKKNDIATTYAKP